MERTFELVFWSTFPATHSRYRASQRTRRGLSRRTEGGDQVRRSVISVQ